MQGSVRIGPSFFAKAKNDYASWRFALIRELFQNSIDAPGSNKIETTISQIQDNTLLVVQNNGQPMSEDELLTKFLALGESGKDPDSGTVGQFGKAKELIAFCHPSYEIHTGDLLVRGSGANFTLEKAEYLHGTKSTIEVAGLEDKSLINQVNLFVSLCQWRGTIFLNNDELTTRLMRGKRRNEFSWGVVYTNNDRSEILVVRVNGVPMFTRNIQYKGVVVVEISGPSKGILQSSRDGLVWDYRNELDEFVTKLITNRKAAFKEKVIVTEFIRFPGFKLVGKTMSQATKVANESSSGTSYAAASLVKSSPDCEVSDQENKQDDSNCVDMPKLPDFYLKNETGLKIPEWFVPGSFGDYAKKLAERWCRALLMLAKLSGDCQAFSIGFIFEEDTVGMFEKTSDSRIIYINPVNIVKHRLGSTVMAKRWSFTSEGNWELLATAIHEFTHHLGYCDHNEEFAVKITDVTGIVLNNMKKFTSCFRQNGIFS